MPQVSVIIPCYNHAHYLEPALASVLCQSFTDWEAIIVDDGSTDNTAAAAEAFFAKFTERNWKLVRQENSGLASARNTGVKNASGEYILPLDADDLLSPVYLERTVPLLDTDPRLGYVYVIVDCFGEEHRTWSGGAFDFRKLLENNLMACSTLFRKKAWEEAGGYNPNMKYGFEDWDLWVAMGEKGWFGKFLQEPLFLYRKHGASMLKDTYAKYEQWSRARLIINHPKLYPSPALEKAKLLLEQAESIKNSDKPKTSLRDLSIMMFHYEKPINPLGVNAGAEMALIHLGRALAKTAVKVTIAGNLPCPEGTYQGVRYVSTGADYNYRKVLEKEASAHSVLLVSARADVLEESLKYPAFKSRLLMLQIDSLSAAHKSPEEIDRLADRILCVSQAHKQQMTAQGLRPEKISILYNGADAELFRPAAVPRDPHRIVYAGALVPLKGVHNLIQAFIEVKKAYPDAVLDIYGSADMWSEREYIDPSANNPAVSGIYFHGKVPQDKLAEGFSRAALAVIPSLQQRPDPHPLTAMEAQSCECPVLVTPSGGLPEALMEGITGRVLPDDRPESINKYLLDLLGDTDKLRQMGLAARERILREFTWDKTAERFLAILSQLNDKKAAGISPLPAKKAPQDIRVGIISTFNQRCGLATYAAYLAQQYPPDKTVIFAEDSLDDRLGTDAPNVHRLWRRGSDDYSFLEKAIRQTEVDIIHINYQASIFTYKNFYLMLNRLRQSGIKVVVTNHVLDEDNQYYLALAQCVDAIIFHMEYSRVQWTSVKGHPDQVHIIPHGVPRIPSTSKEEMRKSLGIPDDLQLYISFGFIEPHKGILENIIALKELKGKFPFLYVVLGGAHPHNEEGQKYIRQCQDTADKLGLTEEVQFMLGFHPDEHIYVMLKAADAIIMNYQSNRYEASGATALALSSGAPIVTSNAPPFSDLGISVLRMTEKTPLGKTLFHLKNNPLLRNLIMKNAAALAEERSWFNTARRIREIYAKLMS